MLFEEPKVQRSSYLGWAEPTVHWLTECSHPEAAESRRTVNTWYSAFPDADGRIADRLRSEVDVDHRQAVDELYVHQTLRRSHDDVRYEEGGVGPDFRVYQDGMCVLAVEVASLFQRSDWSDEDRRHNRLADELNQRIPPTRGYFVSFEIEEARVEPAPRQFADWVDGQLKKLPPHDELVGVSYDDVPTATYLGNGVRIGVRFLPMKPDAASQSDPRARIVGMGKMLSGFVNSGERLRGVIGKKGGERYDVRGAPYVVAVGNHDTFLSDDVVIDGLYGGEAVRFNRANPSKYEVVRRNDGLFGFDESRQQARHRRISAVAVVSRLLLWDAAAADLALYDNLAPESPLADGLLPSNRRFRKVSADGAFGWSTAGGVPSGGAEASGV